MQYLAVQNMVQVQYERSKRSVLPFVGNILSHLFGTLSEEDIEDMSRAISQLEHNQQNTVHLFDEAYSTINVTFEGVRKNRKTINRLSAALVTLRDKVSLLYQPLQDGLANICLVLLVHDVYNILSQALLDTRP